MDITSVGPMGLLIWMMLAPLRHGCYFCIVYGGLRIEISSTPPPPAGNHLGPAARLLAKHGKNGDEDVTENDEE